MSLNMTGHIDGMFKSVEATRTYQSAAGAYVNGIWQPGATTTDTYHVNVQQVSDRELNFLSQGLERVLDYRRIYVNSGNLNSITLDGTWEFIGQKWKTVKLDNRPWRKYCKIIVSRIDDQPGTV